MHLNRRQLLVALPAAIAGLGRWDRALADEPAPAPDDQGPRSHRQPPFEDKVLFDPQTRRRIPLRLRLPATPRPSPLIVYSPGLGSGVSNGAAWCEAWRQAGFVVATLAHPGTDDGLWDTSRRSLRANLAAALAQSQYGHRVKDCRFAIGQCLTGMGIDSLVDPSRIGVAGHSYGALTVQALAAGTGRGKDDLAIGAAIAFSPGGRSAAIAQALAGVRIPFFCVTGDHDNYVTFGQGQEAMRLGIPLHDRLAVYRYLPAGAKQLLVMARADHMTFAGERVSTARFSRDIPSSDGSEVAVWARVSLATMAFWQYYLGNPPGADRRDYLERVKGQLDPADRLEAA
jgi:dienelactone hydrolase